MRTSHYQTSFTNFNRFPSVNKNFNLDQEIDRSSTDATKYAELEEKYGRSDLLPLWIADMDFASPQPVTEALMQCVSQPVLGYTTAPRSFWQSIASWLNNRHGWNVTPADIDFVPGVKKGLGLCINYFTKPGDKIVIQPPVYHSFRSVIEGNGRIAVDNPLVCDGDSYHIDFDDLERIVRENHPAMLILCNPHNPIGIQWDLDSIRRVVDICYENNMLILSDEIYGDLVFRNSRHIPTASVSEKAAEITVTLGAPSKTFNIPGLASAWTAVTSPALRDPFFAWLHASEFDTPPITAIYPTEAAYNKCAPWLDEVLDYLLDNARYARKRLLDSLPGIKVTMPDAGFGLWIDFNALNLSHDDLVDYLVNGAGLALSDGASFGFGGSGFVRLNIGVPRSVLREGIDRLIMTFTPLCDVKA